MKKKLILILLSGIIICTLFSFTACGNKETPAERIERICGIELPEDMEVEYNYYCQAFQGDFTQYTVFKLEEEPIDFLKNNDFSDKSVINDTFEDKFVGSISKEYYPNWEKEHSDKFFKLVGKYSGVDASALYFPDTLNLIFLMQVN